jgi:hypothetical protein
LPRRACECVGNVQRHSIHHVPAGAERLGRLEEEWTGLHLEEMARTFPTKYQAPEGVRQSLKRAGRTWSALRRRMSLKSAQRNLKSLMKKLRVTLKSKAATLRYVLSILIVDKRV